MTSGQAMIRLLNALGLPDAAIPSELEDQIGLYRSTTDGRRLLVVLDSASSAEQIRPLLPASPAGMVLVTSRDRLSGLVTSESAHPLSVELLTADEARDLLTRRLGRDRLAAEPDPVDEIIGLCAGLPLALALVAARAATHPSVSLTALAAQLHKTRGTLDAFTTCDSTTDLRTVFSWSYDSLTPSAARLFRMLALHPGTEIATPAAGSLAGLPTRHVDPLLAELTNAHLLGEQRHDRYVLHDLLRAYAAQLTHTCDPDADRQAAIHRMLDYYLHSAHTAARVLIPHRDPITLDLPQPTNSESLTDHARAMAWLLDEQSALRAAVELAAANGLDTHTWHLSWALAVFSNRRGQLRDLFAMQRIALTTAKRLADLPKQANAHLLAGSAHAQTGHLDAAHTYLRQALNLFAKLGDSGGQADSHLDLANLYRERGSYTDALDHARQALDQHRSAQNRIGIARALNAIGWCHALLADYQQTITCCQHALTLQQELGDSAGAAATWDSLGFGHHQLGQHKQAIDCYQQAVGLRRQIGQRRNMASTLTRLGDTYVAIQDFDAARAAWKDALDVLDGLAHSDAVQVRERLSDLG